MRYSLMISALVAICTLGALSTSHAQQTNQEKKDAKMAALKAIIDSQNYVFKAQQALSMGGRNVQLTTDYDLTITHEKIVSYLPYYGRAYSAPMDPTQGGIQFTSKDFDYTITPRKKGGWTVSLKPKDYRDVQQMTLTISDAGYASLQVTSTNRQPISFQGYIAAVKPKK